jgi:hypothetical protein
MSSGASRDVHDTLAEMDRRLGELQRDLAGVSARSGTARPAPPPPPPPPPAPAGEELGGVEERLSRIAKEARLQADALAKRIDDLTGLRDELERSASQLADAADRARRAQGARPEPPPPVQEEEEEPQPPPTTRGDSFTTDPSPPAWLSPERSTPIEPAMPPVAGEPLAEEEPASVVDDGVEEKAPTVEEPAAEVTEAPGRTVSLDAGPFADIVALSAFEEMLDRLAGVTEVYVRGLEGNRAHIDIRTTSLGSIVDELRAGLPLAFSVTHDDGDSVTMTVEGIAPI